MRFSFLLLGRDLFDPLLDKVGIVDVFVPEFGILRLLTLVVIFYGVLALALEGREEIV